MDLILTFHSLDTSGSVVSYNPDEFRQVVEGLLEEGVALVGLDEMLREEGTSGQPRALLTFDDGFSSVHEHALPLLAELGVPALLYVVTGWVGRTNRWPTQGAEAPELDLMDWSQLRELQAAGFELGSHTVEHPHLADLTEEELERELTNSKGQLEDELQQAVRHFSYPYGTYKSSTTEAVRKHYGTATTTDMRWLEADDDPLLLPRVDAYYLREPRRWAPIFGARTRTYLKGRAALRNVAGHLRR
ncbi:polysaccharide deacetylase [Candidatus Woesearchaeota archaeon]|jgi:peptidoglycan/xylan/chitin deacetylase (PgdA/CDA1 family)|nr:polysaccharide deacetylase [Candidatus Woesearchaeota archaeon]MDP6740378.1 polysaccharide deacetylase family protein [Planctomycetota bacterium]MDP6938395.1 polysaccharide deacetylase family protein [Planctomycetota bacterium]